MGTNLIKQGVNVKAQLCGSVSQFAEHSQGKQEALGSSPGRMTIFHRLRRRHKVKNQGIKEENCRVTSPDCGQYLFIHLSEIFLQTFVTTIKI